MKALKYTTLILVLLGNMACIEEGLVESLGKIQKPNQPQKQAKAS